MAQASLRDSEMPACNPAAASCECEIPARSEYTRRHREAWPLLVRGPESEMLVPTELSSWLRLWGRLGAELFRCFRDGDGHIRSDMIALARKTGEWRGEVVAD